MSWYDEMFGGEQDFYGPSNEELGYVPPPQPNFFENIYNQFQQSPHLQSAFDEANRFRDIVGGEFSGENLMNAGATGFRGLQELGRAGFGDALGLGQPIQVSEDIIGAPYRQLGYLAETARSGQQPQMKPGASLLETLTGSGLENVPPAAQIAREGLQSLGSLFQGASPSEASTIALGQANPEDVGPAVEEGIRRGAGISANLEDVAAPLLDVGLQLGLDPLAPGMAMAGGNANIARILGAVNLPSDVMDVVDTSGNLADVGREAGWDSPEAIRALSTFLGTAGLTGADIAPEILGQDLSAGPVFPPETTMGSEAGSFEFGRDPNADLEAVLKGRNDVDQTVEDITPEQREQWTSEALIGEGFDPIQESFNASQEAALNAKVEALQGLGFGSETIGGLTPDKANELISAQTPRDQFNPNMSFEENVSDVMNKYGVDSTFAEELLKKEGVINTALQTVGPIEPEVLPRDNSIEKRKVQKERFANEFEAVGGEVDAHEVDNDIINSQAKRDMEAGKEYQAHQNESGIFYVNEDGNGLFVGNDGASEFISVKPDLWANMNIELRGKIGQSIDITPKSVENLPVESLIPMMEDTINSKDPAAVAELRESIEASGIKTPLVMDVLEGKKRIADGNTRLRLAQELGMVTVPVEGMTEDLSFVKPSELQANKLNEFVSNVKEKYGKSWRKEMSAPESTQFQDLQMEAVQDPRETIRKNQSLVQAAEQNLRRIEEAVPLAPAQDKVTSDQERIDKIKLMQAQKAALAMSKDTDLESLQEITKEPIRQITSPSVVPPVNVAPPPSNLPPVQPPAAQGPPPPRKPKIQRLSNVSAIQRATLPAERVIERINPEISKREKSYREFHETKASQAVAIIEDAKSEARKIGRNSEERISRFMDGQNIVLSEKESAIAQHLRLLTNNIASMAKDANVLQGFRKNYFTHINENIQRGSSPYVDTGPKGREFGPLEKPRTKEDDEGIKFNFDILKRYSDGAIRRIAESKFLGKGLQAVQGPRFATEPAKAGTKKKRQGTDTTYFLSKYLERLTGQEKVGQLARAGATMRRIVALGDLTLTAILQTTQPAFTASEVGIRRSIRSTFRGLGSLKKSERDALAGGALYPTISHETAKTLGSNKYMHGIPTVDKWGRVHADIAGRVLVDDAKGNFKGIGSKIIGKSSAAAIEKLKELGFDAKELNNPDIYDRVGKAISDKTQFRTDVAHLPLTWSSPAGRMITQYMPYSYAYTKHVLGLFKNPKQNFGRLVRLAAMGALAGEAAADLREVLKSLIPGDDEEDDVIRRMIEAVAGDPKFDKKSWLDKLQAATRSKRIPISSPGWRVIQNLAMIGGAGIFQTILEKVSSPYEYWKIPVGRTISKGVEIAKAVGEDIGESVKKDKFVYRRTGRELLRSQPIPGISGYKVAGKVFPPERSWPEFERSWPEFSSF